MVLALGTILALALLLPGFFLVIGFFTRLGIQVSMGSSLGLLVAVIIGTLSVHFIYAMFINPFNYFSPINYDLVVNIVADHSQKNISLFLNNVILHYRDVLKYFLYSITCGYGLGYLLSIPVLRVNWYYKYLNFIGSEHSCAKILKFTLISRPLHISLRFIHLFSSGRWLVPHPWILDFARKKYASIHKQEPLYAYLLTDISDEQGNLIGYRGLVEDMQFKTDGALAYILLRETARFPVPLVAPNLKWNSVINGHKYHDLYIKLDEGLDNATFHIEGTHILNVITSLQQIGPDITARDLHAAGKYPTEAIKLLVANFDFLKKSQITIPARKIRKLVKINRRITELQNSVSTYRLKVPGRPGYPIILRWLEARLDIRVREKLGEAEKLRKRLFPKIPHDLSSQIPLTDPVDFTAIHDEEIRASILKIIVDATLLWFVPESNIREEVAAVEKSQLDPAIRKSDITYNLSALAADIADLKTTLIKIENTISTAAQNINANDNTG